jgi:hypothetical protein
MQELQLHQIIKCIKMQNMRTTIDIPEELLRLAKARATMRGVRLKDFVSEAIRLALTDNDRYSLAEKSVDNDDRLILSDNNSFPLIRGKCGSAMRELSSDDIHEILEADDIEQALNPRGR